MCENCYNESQVMYRIDEKAKGSKGFEVSHECPRCAKIVIHTLSLKVWSGKVEEFKIRLLRTIFNSVTVEKLKLP